MSKNTMSMVLYVIIIIVAILVSLFYYSELINDSTIKSIYL